MESYEYLLWLAGGATALISIYKVIVKVATWIKKVVAFFTGLDKNVKTVVEHDKDQYLAILRLTVVSSDMPMSERLIAGKTYIDKGGNGDVKHLYNELLKSCNEGST